ncbi:MAG: hypothetical protein MI739_08930, partial [Bacteroidales bacterium]|nr:hypothetical protein [Bacteroidales bacterium]
MKKNKIITIVLVVMLPLCTILTISCNKEDDNTLTFDEAISAVKDNYLANVLLKDAFNEVYLEATEIDSYIISGNFKSTTVDENAPVLTYEPLDQTTWPKTITKDYGLKNMVCEDYRYRRGIITIIASNYITQEGTDITIS